MYHDWIQHNKKTLAICLAVFILLLTGWGVGTYISRLGKVGVTISAVPRDASVTINGKVASSGTHWLIPGNYTVTASKEGFKQRTKTVIATKDKKQNAVALSLAPQSEKAQKWAEANERAYKANEAYGAIEARANGEYFRVQHPIASVLPYTDPYFTLAYEAQPDNSIVLTVATTSPRYRYLAIEKLRELGYNPSDFRVMFTDFKNPLGGSHEQ